MPTLARTPEINTYPNEGLDYDFVVFPGLDHTLHVQFSIIHCKAGFLGVERAVLSFNSSFSDFSGRSCFSEMAISASELMAAGAGETRAAEAGLRGS